MTALALGPVTERVTATDFHNRTDLPEWRVLLGAIHAQFTATSFEAGAAFVQQVAAAADAADHHPDIDLHYPGRVHIVLTTHQAGGMTERDIEMARTISGLADAAGLTSEPTASTTVEVAVDVLDVDAVRPFWKAVLGYDDDSSSVWEGKVYALRDPRGIGPPFWFQQMDEPRPQRNRIHIDVTVPHDEAEERIRAALDAGGTLVNDGYAKAFWVLADPEGNEACICTWQDRS